MALAAFPADPRAVGERTAGHGRPDFFIVGAPKCGTTSLAGWLSRHPEVCMSRPKEPHFFSPNRKRKYRDTADYERCFAHARARHKAVGEASTHTIYYPEAVERMLAYQPEAKFIVCLRNPARMAVSYHNHLVRRLRLPKQDLAQAWRSRDPVFSYYHPEDMPACDYLRSQCALGSHLERLKRLVPEDRLLVVLLEDIAADASRQLGRVTDFLGIAPSANPYLKSNPARAPRSRLLRRFVESLKRAEVRLGVPAFFPIRRLVDWANMVEGKGVETLTPETQAMLDAHFEPEVRKLEALLGRNLASWRASGRETRERPAGA